VAQNPYEENRTNRLIHEQSPYLLQHAHNPVDWRGWGEEAFDLARREDKPVFLSIGYSTCHWCHVMAHESFEDQATAALMNETFVNIKVDREERPDIDAVYMTVCQMMTGQGGWPLSIVLTPDRRPIFAGTYLPRESRFGRIGMAELCERVAELWSTDRQRLLHSAEELTEGLRQVMGRPGTGAEPEPELLEKAQAELADRFDPEHGGFGPAPKFPTPHNLLFLLRRWWRTGEPKAREMAEATLRAMRRGGVYDQLGHGFHRYSTDDEWLLPHFEKMLYDQGMLAMAYTEAWQLFGDDGFRSTAEEVLDYVLRDMTAAEGAFFSAEDADSEGEEGKFYVFTLAEVREVLGVEDASLARLAYGLEEEGNFADEATHTRTGANVLHQPKPPEELARLAGLAPGDLETRLESIRRRLLDYRSRRVRPHRDDKVLTDWNGLFIASLAKAGMAFGNEKYLRAATRAADFLLAVMRPEGKGLLHRWRAGQAGIDGFLDDYAFLVWGLIELYEATFEPRYLRAAAELMDEQIGRFWDQENGGFFFTSQDAGELPVRHKEWMDAALPGGNGVSLSNLLRLGRLLARPDLEAKASALLRAAAGEVSRHPAGYTFLLLGLDLALNPGTEIVLAGDAQRLARALAPIYLPESVVLRRDEALLDLAPYAQELSALDSGAAYVCRSQTCQKPGTDPSELLEMLEKGRKTG